MLSEDKFFQTDDKQTIWQRYCGFLDLSLDEFMRIQELLLLEEIELVADSPLGRRIMNNKQPTSVAEFRRIVPLTTYKDYAPYIGDRQEDALAEKPYLWGHTSGRGGSLPTGEVMSTSCQGHGCSSTCHLDLIWQHAWPTV